MRKAIREVHHELKRTHPHIVRKVTRLFKYRYPKLTVLGILIISAYLIFRQPAVAGFFSGLDNLSYLGIFIAGLLFSYGFTTPFGVGLFLTINPSSMPLAVVIGALGAFISDYVIFRIIKTSFMDEFREIEETRAMKKFSKKINGSITKKARLYLLYIFAGLILASPVPDEFGVALLTGLGHIRALTLAILSLCMKAIGIFLLLSI